MSLRTLILAAAVFAAAPAFADTPSYTLPALGRDLDGIWEGSFEGVGMGLDIAFTVATTETKSTVSVNLLDDAHGIPVSTATRAGAKIRFEMKDIGGSFDGALIDEGSSLQGTWTQAGKRLPLLLRKRTR